MKNIIFKGILAALPLLMAACSPNSLFDDAPKDKISDEKTWESPMLLDEYVNTWYRNMNSGFKTYVPSTALFKSISRYYLPWFGDQLTNGKSDWYNAGYGDVLKANEESITQWARGTWTSCYTQIQYINAFLENMDKVPDATQRKRVEGEAHFFRAYYYYILWRRFGGALLIDHTYNPLTNPEKFPRASYEQMVKFIVDEAEKAQNLLSATYSTADVGRVTSGAAIMLKAKTYLWASSTVFQNKTKSYLGFTDDKSQEMLQKARAAYDELFALGTYQLVTITGTTQDKIRDEYRQIFITKNTSESILEVQHSNDGDYANKFGHTLDRDAASPFFTGTTAAYTPTQNHVDEYGMRGGATYSAQHPYDNRDYRFYANILYNGCSFRDHIMDMATTDGKAGVDITVYGSSTSAAVSRTGYYLGKFVDPTQAINDNDTYASKQNYIIWRLAEAYLDYAEVCFRLGDTSTALDMVNRIRTRVHMDALTAVTWNDIVRERRVEMAFEETTYWDQLRWGTAERTFSGTTNPLKGMTITVRSGVTTYRTANINRFPARVRKFDAKEYYFPIPWAEVRYQGIEQNPDWNEV